MRSIICNGQAWLARPFLVSAKLSKMSKSPSQHLDNSSFGFFYNIKKLYVIYTKIDQQK